ncbi:MAG: hypothetical protein KKB81_02920 [Candidatus Margulisbacteria bacterium]|nr:hypothetical protein [Candidatus Margulisiibacteriota bacterium]MBU1022198.1 hypothetical protein [Candidatus Margulisiibacteriota bacterium]MBU1729363.1 hypothetical protein [Candidatus Margulisiibacteriota bacterium]MBU1955636.1 hypothetical protein [Candidatus Margulisiibacteriota bacterium]
MVSNAGGISALRFTNGTERQFRLLRVKPRVQNSLKLRADYSHELAVRKLGMRVYVDGDILDKIDYLGIVDDRIYVSELFGNLKAVIPSWLGIGLRKGEARNVWNIRSAVLGRLVDFKENILELDVSEEGMAERIALMKDWLEDYWLHRGEKFDFTSLTADIACGLYPSGSKEHVSLGHRFVNGVITAWYGFPAESIPHDKVLSPIIGKMVSLRRS